MARAKTELREEIAPPLHPRLTEQLVGHAALETQLLGMIHAKRLPHALLLAGPRGIGKATLAYRLARFMLAAQESDDSLFGEPPPPESLHLPASHPLFRRMAAASHPDFLALESDDIKVDETRQVAGFLSLTPAESAWRVVLIDSADAMNRNAANALLKTLEEPPARALLLLVSHNPGALLPTIRSRCRMMRVPPLNPEEFARVMARIAPETSATETQKWDILSGGSPGVALSLQQAKADKLYDDLLERFLSPDTLKNHAFADRFTRKEAGLAWLVLSRMFQWLIARIVSPLSEPEVFPGESEMLARLRAKKQPGAWIALFESAGRLLADTNALHLDKKQAVLTLLNSV